MVRWEGGDDKAGREDWRRQPSAHLILSPASSSSSFLNARFLLVHWSRHLLEGGLLTHKMDWRWLMIANAAITVFRSLEANISKLIMHMLIAKFHIDYWYLIFTTMIKSTPFNHYMIYLRGARTTNIYHLSFVLYRHCIFCFKVVTCIFILVQTTNYFQTTLLIGFFIFNFYLCLSFFQPKKISCR